MTTLTLASILAANATKREAEEQEAFTAEKASLLQDLAEATEYLDSYIEAFAEIHRDLEAVRAQITAIQDSPTVSNTLLEELIEKSDEVMNGVNFAIIVMAEAIVAEEVTADCECFHSGGLVDLSNFVGFLVGENPSETVVPHAPAE